MKKAWTLILVLVMAVLSGCSEIPAIEAQEKIDKPLVIQTETKSESESSAAPGIPPKGALESAATPDPAEKETHQQDGGQANEPEAAVSTPKQTESAESEPESITVQVEIIEEKPEAESDVTEPPAADPDPTPVPEHPQLEPTPEPDPIPEPDPTPTPEPEPEPDPVPAFDISYWTDFAVSYGQQAGLSYDSTATECWDNPIIASPNSIYLERDITSRLNRYVRYGYTAFCVWSEPLADGRYNIYIGYA